jgi:hypothetical protein
MHFALQASTLLYMARGVCATCICYNRPACSAMLASWTVTPAGTQPKSAMDTFKLSKFKKVQPRVFEHLKGTQGMPLQPEQVPTPPNDETEKPAPQDTIADPPAQPATATAP